MYIVAGCVVVLFKNPKANTINISDLLEELKPPGPNINTSINNKLAGKGHKSFLNIVLLITAVLLIIYYCLFKSQNSQGMVLTHTYINSNE